MLKFFQLDTDHFAIKHYLGANTSGMLKINHSIAGSIRADMSCSNGKQAVPTDAGAAIRITLFHFKKSGNACAVFVELDPDNAGQIRDIRVEWDSFPPILCDAKVWSRQYLPLVLRKVAELIGGTVAGVRTVVSPGDPVVFQVDGGKGPNPSRPN